MDGDSLPKCEANYTPLTPLTFLTRAASSYSNRTSLIYDAVSFTWSQTYDRCRRLASSLHNSLNIRSSNDVVSILAPNIPAIYEMHFAVPMAGGVLNTLNTRLDAAHLAAILNHSQPKLLFVDYEFVPKIRLALRTLIDYHHYSSLSLPLVIVIDDLSSPKGIRFNELHYEGLIIQGDSNFLPTLPNDEWAPIALNYTSGTTSAPKGVVYSHRGAFLSTLSLILAWEMPTSPVYLWTLPMFHCNGWTFTWGVAARGGTNICLRHVTASNIYNNISLHHVTHMCCAPIIFTILLESESQPSNRFSSPVEILTGGAPPPAALLQRIEKLGFHVTHAYGLTEATGPALICEWDKKWDSLPEDEKSKMKARQGISVLTVSDVDVKDLDTMKSVKRDGKTMGEIVLKGSGMMKGYYKDREETKRVFCKGWFRTGDVGVIHKDGYVEIKDRSKDVIISGGENISSVEVESVLYKHPMVAEVAVVAMPHPRWGESPCAFVALKKKKSKSSEEEESSTVTEGEMKGYCRKRMAHFMVPKVVKFVEELPKTATGKIVKAELREIAKGFVDGEEEEHQTTSSRRRRSNSNNNNDKDNSNNGNMGGSYGGEQGLPLSRL